MQGSIAFPEIVVPLTVTLRKGVRKASGGKEAGLVKGLLERVDEGAKWVEQKRKTVTFGPKSAREVLDWELSVKLEDTPMGKYVKTQRKIREKRRKLVDKVSSRLMWLSLRLTMRVFRRGTERKRCWRRIESGASFIYALTLNYQGLLYAIHNLGFWLHGHFRIVGVTALP